MTPRSTSRGILYATLPTDEPDEGESTAAAATDEPTATGSNAGPAPADD